MSDQQHENQTDRRGFFIKSTLGIGAAMMVPVAIASPPKREVKQDISEAEQEELAARKAEPYWPGNHPLQEEILIAIQGLRALCCEWEKDPDSEAYEDWCTDMDGLNYQLMMFDSVVSSTIVLWNKVVRRSEEHTRDLLARYETQKAKAKRVAHRAGKKEV